jgi:DNA polymerase I-like protein with 3'-5' exonuclease and polymerase domains
VTRWTAPALVDLPRLSGRVGFDIETRDPMLKTHGPGWAYADAGEIVGYAFAWGPVGQRQKMYLPVAHEGGGNLPKRGVERFVRDTLKNSGVTLIVHNALYEKGWLRRTGIPMRGKVLDTQTAAPMIDEYRFSYSLDNLAKDYLGRGKNEEGLLAYGKSLTDISPASGRAVKRYRTKDQIKGNLYRFPAHIVGPYAEDDALDALDLWDVFEPLVRASDQWALFEMETRIQDVLIEMRWRGVRVQHDEVEQALVRLRKEQQMLQRQLDTFAGFHVDVNIEPDLKRLFRAEGTVPPLTRTGKDSFRKAWLDTVDSPAGKLVNGVRRIEKAIGTFLEGCVLKMTVNGRVHGTFHPQKSDDGGAVTGRFSGSKPNLQFLPARDKEIKRLVRGAFLPEEGEEWAACDYSQQEPRLTVHYAVLGKIKGARKAKRAYIENPDMDYHQFMAEICQLPRDNVKPINLGIGYGMGGAKLCRSLGYPTKWIDLPDRKIPGKTVKVEVAGDEGQAILDQYNENAPFVKGLSKECERRAKERGEVYTLMGRVCRLSGGRHGYGRRDWHYKAMNRLIQGSAADQTKLAMLACWEAGLVPLVTVHDELGFSVPNREVARHIAHLMETCVTLEVPSKVDVELGPSWGLAAELLKSEQDDDTIDWGTV